MSWEDPAPLDLSCEDLLMLLYSLKNITADQAMSPKLEALKLKLRTALIARRMSAKLEEIRWIK